MERLAILDGNCYMHLGSSDWCKDFAVKGFPTGGIYHLMNQIAHLVRSNTKFIIVFDSPSFRKKLDTEYKKSRKLDYKIIAEINALVPCLRRAGVNVLQVPEFEGDDLIANVIKANPDKNIAVYTCDYDACINVSENVIVNGCKTGFPCVHRGNFNMVVRDDRDQAVPYNLLALNKMIYGCKSDEIKAVADADTMWNTILYIADVAYFQRGNSPVSNKETIDFFLGVLTNSGVSQDTIRQLQHNAELVLPRYLTQQEIDANGISLTVNEEPSISGLKDTCALFCLKRCYGYIDGKKEVPPELTEKQELWLKSKAKDYYMRKDAVDAEIDINRCVTDNDEDESDAVYNSVVNGMNVGGF